MSPQSSNKPSPADNFQLDLESSSTENLIESLTNTLVLLTQSYKSHLPQINNQLRTSSNARNKATVQDDRVVVQDVRGRYNVNNQGRPFQMNNARVNVVARNAEGQNRGGNVNHGQAKPIKCYNCNGLGHIAQECPRPKQLQDLDYLKDKMLLMQAQENGAVLDEEQLLFLAGEQVTNFDDDVDDPPEKDLALNVDHIFEADQCDAFDSDVDEAPNIQTMFMVNLSSEDPIYDEVGPSYDSNTPFSNIIPYNQYVEDNEENVVQSNVSSVQNDALMSIINEMHEDGVQQGVQSRVNTSTEASESKPISNTKKNRILPAKSENKKKVEDHPRTNNSVNATPTVKIIFNKRKRIWKPKGKLSDNSLNKTKRVWKATGKLFADIGYQWRPTGKKFTLGKLNCGYQWRPTGKKFTLGELCPLTKLSVKCRTGRHLVSDSGCSNIMTGNRSKLKNFCWRNVISRVYYVEGLGHNLFSVGQFCDSDLEIAFRKHSCFVRDMNGVTYLR
ncbi:retrovirus-related pol polyprotein from transposon TNT 1-94 [Tanacetum coccineum]